MKILHLLEKWVDFGFACWPRPKPAPEQTESARLIAHRGAHDGSAIQENTAAAFERALQLGCWGIELDVHACADEILVVNHDPDLKRLWGHPAEIRKTDFESLRKLTPTLPSLDEVVTQYGKKLHLFIELKSPFSAVEALAQTLAPLTPCEDYHLISLDESILPKLTLFPNAALILIPVHNNVAQFCHLSLKNNYGGVLGHYLLLRNRQIKALNQAKQLVGIGFVDSKYSLYRELNRGLRYLFTNQAEKVSQHLQRLGIARTRRDEPSPPA